jgi:hypothetical protein
MHATLKADDPRSAERPPMKLSSMTHDADRGHLGNLGVRHAALGFERVREIA